MIHGYMREATAQEHDAGTCEDDCLECQVHKARRQLQEAAKAQRDSSDGVCKSADRLTRLARRITEERDASRESQRIPRNITITAEHIALPAPKKEDHK